MTTGPRATPPRDLPRIGATLAHRMRKRSTRISDTVAVPVLAAATLGLRGRILRPGRSPQENIYPFDDAPESGHFAVQERGDIVAVGSIFLENRGSDGPAESWRIRGMATAEERRGLGYGAAVLRALIHHAQEHRAESTAAKESEIWCNGRTTVEGFYRRFGFQPVGDVFDLPGLGPHLVMVRPLDEPSSPR